MPAAFGRAGNIVGLVLLGLALGCARKPPERWEAVTIPTRAIFDGIYFTDSLNGWLAGGGYLIDGGILGRTRDGGRTWRFHSGVFARGGPRFALGHIQFRDTLNGIAVGSGGTVLRTADGGESWRDVRHGRSPADGLSQVQFVDERNGWAIGGASLLRTDDGGERWRPLVYGTSENGYFSGNAIHLLDADHGWLVAHSGILKQTNDGGLTWSRVSLPLPVGDKPTLWDITFTDAMHGWVVGEHGSIFHTSDGGSTWIRQVDGVPVVRVIPKGEQPRPREPLPELEFPPDRLNLTAVRFLDSLHGYTVGYYADVAESVILGTRDGGATWRVERVQPGELLRSLFVLDRAHAWAAGDRARLKPQVILRSTGLGL